MIKTRPCRRCQHDTVQEIHKCITHSGSEVFAWRCQECDQWVPQKDSLGVWIKRETLIGNGLDLDALPVIMELGERCAVCGKRGTEEHHWMPQGLVGKERANMWPKDWLCKEHHDEWHRIVTPTLVTFQQ